MTKFKCNVCDKYHQLYTLVESPRPEVIKKITSGELNQSLNVIAKSIFVVNREYGLFECKLTINLIDDDDTLDLNIWLEVDGKIFFEKAIENKKMGKISLLGNSAGFIPFYEYNSEAKFEIEVDLDKDELPIILKVLSEGELNEDFEKGINRRKLEKFITQIYHPK